MTPSLPDRLRAVRSALEIAKSRTSITALDYAVYANAIAELNAILAGRSCSRIDATSTPASVQERTCERCGAVKLRFAR